MDDLKEIRSACRERLDSWWRRGMIPLEGIPYSYFRLNYCEVDLLVLNSLIASTVENTNLPYYNPYPVVKLSTQESDCVWLLSELQPFGNWATAFGLCDLGVGFPELGSVCLEELSRVSNVEGICVSKESWYWPTKRLSQYAQEARTARCIVA